VKALQQLVNDVGGLSIAVDGIPGNETISTLKELGVNIDHMCLPKEDIFERLIKRSGCVIGSLCAWAMQYWNNSVYYEYGGQLVGNEGHYGVDCSGLIVDYIRSATNRHVDATASMIVDTSSTTDPIVSYANGSHVMVLVTENVVCGMVHGSSNVKDIRTARMLNAKCQLRVKNYMTIHKEGGLVQL